MHTAYRAWLEATVGAAEPFGLSVLVAAGFVRIVTNPRIYKGATPIGVALASLEALIERPNCRLIGPGPRHLDLFATLCRATRATGKLVTDAQHAAVAIENGCTFVTRDGDFAAFAKHGLRWQHLTLEP